MTIEEALVRVQCAYPKIYLACHARHQNAKTTRVQLSQRDSTVLAHLDEVAALGQGELARHLGVAKSTFSETVDGLVVRGFVARLKSGRSIGLLRSPAGTLAMSGSSVLESARLGRLLQRLDEDGWARVVAGLELLAEGRVR